MTIYKLNTPISEQDVRRLKVNDVVYLSGVIVTARDQAHKRALKEKVLPLPLVGLGVYHCGPVMHKKGKKWIAVSAGPTTSTRMDVYGDEFLKEFRPSVIIGKGGMGKRTADAMAKFGTVYCVFTGGAAVLAAKAIRRVRDVVWLDLGMPEAMWVLEVEEFGPLVVAIDSHGGNLFADITTKADANKQSIYQKFGL